MNFLCLNLLHPIDRCQPDSAQPEGNTMTINPLHANQSGYTVGFNMAGRFVPVAFSCVSVDGDVTIIKSGGLRTKLKTGATAYFVTRAACAKHIAAKAAA